MKKILFSLLTASVFLGGCLETTQEITLKEDGSGNVSTTSDMSSVLGLAKQMGGGNDLEKMSDQKLDTVFSLGSQADSMQDLGTEEKEMLKKGTMAMKMNLKDDQFLTKLDFPFNEPGEIGAYGKLTNKLLGNAMKEQMKGSPMSAGAGEDVPPFTSFDDYYKLSFSKGELKKSLDKEKYAGASSDGYLAGLKQATGMGIPVTYTWVINLPSPADKVEGKNAKLSDDKMKVTVKVSIEDFFDEPESLEFKIKY